MKFNYIASLKTGEIERGTIESSTEMDAFRSLQAKGLQALSLKLEKNRGFFGDKQIIGQKVTVEDKIFLTKYLALMLKVNTGLIKAIDILMSDFKKPVLKAILGEIRSALERGEQFYKTFEKYPQFFSPVFINMVKAGEQSGTLEKSLEDLSVSLEREKNFSSKVKGALIYPALLFGLSILILLFLVTFALPKIAGIFQGGGFNPPLFSRVVFGVGLFLADYIGIIFIFLSLIIIGGVIFFWKTNQGRRLWLRILYKIPFVKDILYKVAIQRFAAVFGSLLASGVSMMQALHITADAVSHIEIRESLIRVAEEGIARGTSLGDAFKREVALPSVIRNLVAVAEKAGHLDEILGILDHFYEAEIETSLKTFISFLEPVMLLVIGAVVGLIALSIIVPIYQLVGQI